MVLLLSFLLRIVVMWLFRYVFVVFLSVWFVLFLMNMVVSGCSC